MFLFSVDLLGDLVYNTREPLLRTTKFGVFGSRMTELSQLRAITWSPSFSPLLVNLSFFFKENGGRGGFEWNQESNQSRAMMNYFETKKKRPTTSENSSNSLEGHYL